VQVATRRPERKGATTISRVSDSLGIELDRLSAQPIARQLADALRARILDGTIPPDRKLPSQGQLAAQHQIGQGTAARALAQLQAEGLAVFVPGRGAFSAPADVIAKARRKR
jgi:DNA-binding GntR family transcriptional regulator